MNQNLDPKQNSEQNTNPQDPAVNTDETKTTAVEKEAAAETTETTTAEQSTAPAADTSETAVPEDNTSAQPEAGEKAGSMTGVIVGAIVLALLMIGGVWYFMSGTNVTQQPADTGTDEAGATATTLLGLDEGEPTDPVVEVNDEVLERAAYNRLRQQLAGTAQQQGMDLRASSTIEQINNQALDTLVNTELIRQAAVAAGQQVEGSAVDTRFNEIVEQVGGTDALASSLEELGLTEASLRADVEQELLIQGYLDTQTDTESFTATEEEVTALYNEAGGEDAGLPPLEEVRPQIEQQIEANKEQEAINAIVDALRDDAEVNILI